VKDGKPAFHYNYFDVEHVTIASGEPLAAGRNTVRAVFKPLEPGPGKAADVTLFVNDREVAKGQVPRTVAFRYGVEPFDVGMDTVSPVSGEYKSPFPFQGRIKGVTISLE
jgi:arylsulfatase